MTQHTNEGKTIRLPRVFFTDHVERGLAAPAVLKETAKHFVVHSQDPAILELYSDARFYADKDGPQVEGTFGRSLKASAKATVAAIEGFAWLPRAKVGG